ncbi:hypothetical protein N7541_005589 [Penicillium brevicompactum]|uniref:CENP-V/GFA domain-containing protein n=1 Tax=Penicillium brevicompactum TaxID=5074 RepID=A0A9W9R6J0_PENBR|nr:hypothetical protein N7541_005589 [Penicillium brevicompactum]
MSETTVNPASMVSYDGGCHCGNVSYTAKLPSPIQDQVVNTCNCSICSINGYILVYIKKPDLTFHNSDDAAKEYRFGSKRFPHYFCPNCGTSVYASADDTEGEYAGITAINGRTLKGVDINSLKIEQLDGKKI